MCPKANPESLKIQKDNLSKFKAHLAKIKKDIQPEVDCATIYAGKYNSSQLDLKKELKTSLGADVERSMSQSLTKVYKLLEAINKTEIRKSGKLKFDTLADVLGDLPSPPAKCPDEGVSMKFRSMLEYAFIAGEMKRGKGLEHTLLPYKASKELWKLLSKIYVENSKGDMRIIEGVMGQHKELDETKVLINTEITKVMKNSKLDMAARKKAADLVTKYIDKMPSKKSKLFKDLESFHDDFAGHLKACGKSPVA